MIKYLVLLLLMYCSQSWADCTIKMVFKLGDKSPLMAAAPDNSGIFEDLYTEAAKRINCKLTITRLPKQRLHSGLKRGDYDFYPAASFSKKRSEYLIYHDNGLITSEYGISSNNLPEISSLNQLADYDNLIWLMESNSSKSEIAQRLGIYSQQIKYVNIDVLGEFVRTRPQYKYFYIIDIEVLNTFTLLNSKQALNNLGLRLHPKCCSEQKKMFLAFSSFSKHLSETNNEYFDQNKNLSPENQVSKAKTNSIAFKFFSALKALKVEGKTKEIYERWNAAIKK